MTLVVPFEELFRDETKLLSKHTSWERVPLGDVCRVLNGFAFKSNSFGKTRGFPLIRIRDLARGRTETLYAGDYAEEYVVRNGDLLVGMDGNFGCYEWNGGDGLLNQRVCKLIPNEEYLDRKFLLFGINGYLRAIQDATSSVTVGHLSSRDIQRIPFPFPSLNEQRRIVAKLERLLSRVDAAQDRLATIPHILKRFRQSVLAAACSGRLTADWRHKNRVRGAWPVRTLTELGAVSGGITKSANRRMMELRKPYLRVANVYENRLALGEVLEIGLTEPEFRRTRLTKHDVLFVEGNGSLDQIGRVALWDGSIKDCVHQNHLIKFRTNGLVLPPYVLLQMMSPAGRAQLVEKATSSAGLNTLSISKISAIRVPVPPKVEQQEIVRRVEALFKTADALEARYQKAKTHVDILKQSILAKAFRGELVPQDPT